ncbi:MAG: hypothetical protein U0324_13450 [Polyangiales bacterium]
MRNDTPMLHHRFEACVGRSLDDAWFLATRHDAADGPYSHARCEWWVGRLDGGAVGDLWGTRTPLSRLVAGPAGAAYVFAERRDVSGDTGEESGVWALACEDDAIRITPVAALGGLVQDIAALGDGTLLAWAAFDRTLRRYDGETVGDLPYPPIEHLEGLAGPDPSWIFAWSAEGQVAIWHGGAWSPVTQLPVQFLKRVVVRGPEEAYAGALLPPGVWRWDGAEWRGVAAFTAGVLDLCVHAGDLLASVDTQGLLRVRADGVELVSGALEARALHAGADALIAVDDPALRDTRDLRAVREVPVEAFAALIAKRTPLWATAELDTAPSAFTRPLPRSLGLADLGPVRYGFADLVGDSLDDAFFLASRGEPVERQEPEERESIVGRIVDGVVRHVVTARPVLRSLQRVPSGRVYVAAWSQRGGIWRTPPDGTLAWEPLDCPPMQGLFALDDACVMAWGGVGLDPVQDFFLYDGRSVRAIPSPGARVLGVHGCAPDWIVAAGHGGLLSRWDGSAWHRWTIPTRGTFGNLVVVSPDEMYATGPLGSVYEGSRHGWAERTPAEGAPVGIARWRGETWVGDPTRGLLRLTGDRLEPAKAKVFPFNLHAGADALLMTEGDAFAETRDLKTVRRIDASALEVALRNHRPSWR